MSLLCSVRLATYRASQSLARVATPEPPLARRRTTLIGPDELDYAGLVYVRPEYSPDERHSEMYRKYATGPSG